ncbi:MAG TPA: DUF4383 domain-containing protein [Thermoanaerobaculia bacterium]|nr:DUF4383 domain-containing protein [Thermoanaerobaculia bacterium]
MANRIATILGIGFLLVGIVGFVAPGILGMHLSPAHNVVHLVTGAVSLYLGLKGSPGAAKTFCILFGLVYLLLGVAGFLIGADTAPGVPGPHDARMLKIVRGTLEFGTSDHIVHILLGAVYFLGGLMTRAVGAARGRV